MEPTKSKPLATTATKGQTEAEHAKNLEQEMKWYFFNDLSVKEILMADHAVTRDATGFIFELVEDGAYDRSEHDENTLEWRKRHGLLNV